MENTDLKTNIRGDRSANSTQDLTDLNPLRIIKKRLSETMRGIFHPPIQKKQKINLSKLR